MGASPTDRTAVSMLLIGIGTLLGGLGVCIWGVRHVFFARRELEEERATPSRIPKPLTAS